MTNPFLYYTGSRKINNPLILLLLLISFAGVALFIARDGFFAIAVLLVLPFAAMFLIKSFENPVVSFFAVYVANFLALGLSRYVIDAPFGLLVDGFLLLTYLTIFFKYFYEKFDWSILKNQVVFVALIWYGYTLFELINPEIESRKAWIYYMRGVSLYMLMTIILVIILFDKFKYVKYFVIIWFVFEILGSIKGMGQLYIGLDPYEQFWLDVVGRSTHVLFGELRVFSFFSDAGQFGASQGHTGVVATILLLTTKSKRLKVFFAITAFFCYYGMFISGTRGIWGVLAGGAAFFLAINRNLKLFIVGAAIAASVFVFFRYTYIGHNYYFIRRMRSAFDPKEASLQMRKLNQAKLRPYLATRPFGGGIGNAGAKAQRFTPNTFLSNTATDSWYVEIWSEQGIVGLILHLSLMSFILIKGSYIVIYRVQDPELKGYMVGLLSGIFGIMVSSYGNGVFGQMPTGLIMYTSMAFIFTSPKLDKQLADEKREQQGLLTE